MKSNASSAKSAAIDIGIAALSIIYSLWMALGLIMIASPAIPFADALWLTLHLVGPMLLLAAGLRSLLYRVPGIVFICGFCVIWILIGIYFTRITGYNRLAVGWVEMIVFVGVVLLALRKTKWWAVIGSTWTAILLSAYTFSTIRLYVLTVYRTASFPSLSLILLIEPLIAVLTIIRTVQHFRRVAQP